MSKLRITSDGEICFALTVARSGMVLSTTADVSRAQLFGPTVQDAVVFYYADKKKRAGRTFDFVD